MINSKDFGHRLQKIMDFYQLTASSFADSIGAQRSSISHILSGRNKPSLDFVMKILDNYPEVELYWLLNGKGKFPTEEPLDKLKKNESTNNTIQAISENHNKNNIERIVIFYKDGTFKSFNN